MNTKTCSQCGETKTAIFLGLRRPRKSIKIYHDEEGRQWACAVCPECRYTPTKPKVITARKCTRCAKTLKSDRYFNCTECLPALEEDLGEFIYHVA